MPFWPQRPMAGELVGLPLALPPMLCAAVGHPGSGPHLGMYWTPYGDELIHTDDELTATGWWHAWNTLCQHQVGRAVLGPYRLGSGDGEAQPWLLGDRGKNSLDVGLTLDVRRLLATQPSEVNAAADILGAEHTRALSRITSAIRRPSRLRASRRRSSGAARWWASSSAGWTSGPKRSSAPGVRTGSRALDGLAGTSVAPPAGAVPSRRLAP
jgi:hypothetical protein